MITVLPSKEFPLAINFNHLKVTKTRPVTLAQQFPNFPVRSLHLKSYLNVQLKEKIIFFFI